MRGLPNAVFESIVLAQDHLTEWNATRGCADPSVTSGTRESSFKSCECLDDVRRFKGPIAAANVDLPQDACVGQSRDRVVDGPERALAEFARTGPSLARHSSWSECALSSKLVASATARMQAAANLATHRLIPS
jgi:hypothetical protein